VHDRYIPSIEKQFGFAREEIVTSILSTLKPGGILGVVDGARRKRASTTRRTASTRTS